MKPACRGPGSTTTARRVRALVEELAGQGVTFHRDGDRVTVAGIRREPWLVAWLERHQHELGKLFPKPRRRPAVRHKHLEPPPQEPPPPDLDAFECGAPHGRGDRFERLRQRAREVVADLEAPPGRHQNR